MEEILPNRNIDFNEYYEYYCISINPKNVQNIIKELSKLFPINSNIKRAKKSGGDKIDVLIDDISKKELIDNWLKTINIEYIESIKKVPKYQPLTYKQYQICNSIWPISFHLNKLYDPLKEDEINKMKEYMKEAIKQAYIGKENGFIGIGGIIVNPINNKIIASYYDTSRNKDEEIIGHPLNHCSINLINQFSNNILIKTGKREYSSDIDKYLCTGYDIYLTREPCIMCSMALVHSRIFRIIYGIDNLNSGGVCSKYLLHSYPSLNHHFKVYHKLLEEECIKINN